MSQNESKNWWSEKRIRAAQLVAEGELTDQQIAEIVKASRQSVTRWKAEPIFRDRVNEIVADLAEALSAKGIRLRENRLKNLQTRVDKMMALIEARALDLADIAGGSTGLLVRDYKHGGTVYKFDAALLRELREHEKQAAQELGQWLEKVGITGGEGQPLFAEMAEVINRLYDRSSNKGSD